MGKVTVKVLDDGPNVVMGDIELVDGADNPIEKPEEYALCRCGLSDNMPFCTGAHQGKFKNTVRSK